MSVAETTPEPAAAKTVAAIDIGSNTCRMAIAQVTPDGGIETLEQLQRAARMGQDAFRRGRLGAPVMRGAVAILRDYRRVLDLYHVSRIRAVATSAVREASNADTFLDRILMATGLDVEVIDTSEESRLTVSAVLEELGDDSDVKEKNALVVEVGGGSTVLTVLERGEIASSQSMRLGSIRLQEVLETSYETPERTADLLRHQIANSIAVLKGTVDLGRIERFVAVGGDARFAAAEVGRPGAHGGLTAIRRKAFDAFVERCERHTAEELARVHGLPFADAETLGPALLVYQELWRATSADRMLVSGVSMRDGLLLDLGRSVTGREDTALAAGVIHSALTLAEKFREDESHARAVADLSVRLFDEMQAEHGLSGRHRLLLRVAALLHEAGGFVSSRAHHKHSYYLIANSEIFGLAREEITIVALVARYHRRSAPKPSHAEYMALPRESRMVVSKLAALLRVGDALDRGHAHLVRDFTCERRGDEMVLTVRGVADLALERRAMAAKGDLFEDIYGMRVRLEEERLAAAEHRRAPAVE